MGDNPTEIILKILNRDEVNDFNRDFVESGRWKDIARFKKDLRIPLADILSVDNEGITTNDNYIPFSDIATAGHALDVTSH